MIALLLVKQMDASIITSLLQIFTSLLHRPPLLPIITHFSLPNLQMYAELLVPWQYLIWNLAATYATLNNIPKRIYATLVRNAIKRIVQYWKTSNIVQHIM